MKLLNLKFISLLVPFVFGIITAYYIKWSFLIWFLLFLGFFIALVIVKIRADRRFLQKSDFVVLVSITFFLLGTVIMTLHCNPDFESHHTKHQDYAKAHYWVISIKRPLKASVNYNRYEAAILQRDSLKVAANLILNIKKDSFPRLTIGTEFVTRGSIQKIRKSRNPGQFDYAVYLGKKQIYHQLYLNRKDLHTLKTNSSLITLAGELREKIRQKLKSKAFGAKELAIINALLLGYRYDITKEMNNAFASAGVIHVLAISGLHIGILLFFLNVLFEPMKRLKNGQTYKSIVIILLLWGFALLTGLSPSVVRAVTMFSFFAYAINRKKVTNTTHVLAVSMFFLLLFNPLFIFDVGFQLSYAAVFAILWIQPMLAKRFVPKFKITKYLWSVLSVTLAAQLGLLPLSLFYFHQFPGLFFLSNLVILPFLGLILGFGVLIIILCLVELLPEIVVEIYSFILRLLHTFVSWVAQQEAFIFRDIFFDNKMLIASYLLLIALVFLLKRVSKKNILAVVFCALVFFGVFTYNLFLNTDKNTFIVFHQNRKTLLAVHEANVLRVYMTLGNKVNTLFPIKNYRIQYPISTIITKRLPYYLNFKDNRIVILDSLQDSIPFNSYLLLRNSPKINLERIIVNHKPKLIIADGSNYTSFKKRWKATCSKQKLPFHDTSEQGAFILDY